MQDIPIVNRRSAGIDVHKAFVTVAVRTVKKRKIEYVDGRFETTSAGLLALADWLRQHGVEHVVMEPIRTSTGSPSGMCSRARWR